MRVALTGGASGIGAAVAADLKAQGHHVTAFDITEPHANVDQWIPTDLSDDASIRAAIAAANGPYDALINNAGLPPRDGLAELILRVNFFGLRLFMDGLSDKLCDSAAIVNVASRAGAQWRENLDEVKALIALNPAQLTRFISERGITPTRAYNLSKEAVIVMTMAGTKRLISRNLRANSISPAAISTDILKDFAAAFGDQMARNVALVGRPGMPSEVASAIVFLASPASNWIRGQDIVIDGGMSAMLTSQTLGLDG